MSSNQRSIFLKDSQDGVISSLNSSLSAFADFQVDVQNRVLRKGEKLIALTPKAFDVLVLLIQHRGEVVSKDELIKTVWPDSFVEESNLTQTVFMLRKALGESSTRRYVLTVQGRGYRFAPEVRVVSEHREGEKAASRAVTIGSGPTEKAGEPPVPTKHITTRAALAFAVFAFLAVAIIVWLYPSFSRRASASPPVRSIAVLPLDNLSGDPSQDFFADAMTDELITNLAKVDSLRVTSRTTIALYKRTSKKLPDIARELNVDGIVEGLSCGLVSVCG